LVASDMQPIAQTPGQQPVESSGFSPPFGLTFA
jgi:hypothetical protein